MLSKRAGAAPGAPRRGRPGDGPLPHDVALVLRARLRAARLVPRPAMVLARSAHARSRARVGRRSWRPPAACSWPRRTGAPVLRQVPAPTSQPARRRRALPRHRAPDGPRVEALRLRRLARRALVPGVSVSATAAARAVPHPVRHPLRHRRARRRRPARRRCARRRRRCATCAATGPTPPSPRAATVLRHLAAPPTRAVAPRLADALRHDAALALAQAPRGGEPRRSPPPPARGHHRSPPPPPRWQR
jgi:hypothetical protein